MGMFSIGGEQGVKDTLKKIEKSLNCRFEKDEKLYIDRQSKYDIRKKLRTGAWQGIYNGVFLEKGISADILATEIIKSSWLINKEISDRDYKKMIEPILDAATDKVFYVAMEDILENKISVRDDFKIRILSKYYKRISSEKIKKSIDLKDSNLNISEIGKIVIEQLFSKNLKIEVKMEYFKKVYEYSDNLRKEQIFIKREFEILYKEKKTDIEYINKFILENYLYKTSLNEKFWLQVMAIPGEKTFAFIESYTENKFLNQIPYDRYVLRSLLRDIILPHINTNSKLKKEAKKSIEKISKNYNINQTSTIECKILMNHIRDKKIANELDICIKNDLENVRFRGGYKNKLTKTDIKWIDEILKNKSLHNTASQEAADFVLHLVNDDFSIRKEFRVLYSIEMFRKLSNKEPVLNSILNCIDKNNFRDFIEALILKSDDSFKNIVLEVIIYKCENEDEKVRHFFIEFMKKNKLKNRRAMLYLRELSFKTFAEAFGRTV